MTDENMIGYVNEHEGMIKALRQDVDILTSRADAIAEQLDKIQNLLDGKDTEAEGVLQWDYSEIRHILNRTDLTPDMKEQELVGLMERVQIVEEWLGLGTLGHPDVSTCKLIDRVEALEHRISARQDRLEVLQARSSVGKSPPPEPKPVESQEQRAVRLTVELAMVLRELDANEDESSCRLKEGIVEALERAAGLEVG